MYTQSVLYSLPQPIYTFISFVSLVQSAGFDRFETPPSVSPQNLNFTGFRKILKKHDKILETSRGADWRVVHVEVAPFYTCKKITQLISETEVTHTHTHPH